MGMQLRARDALVGFVALVLACDKQAAPQIPVPTAVPSAKLAQTHGATGSPHAGAPSGQAAAALSGPILETMNAGGYTYMHLDTSQGPVWTAIREAKLKKGDRVQVVGAMLMTNFTSPTLKRTFEQIYFGTLGDGAATATPQPSGAKADLTAAHQRAHGGGKETIAAPIAKAEGAAGRTVAELFAQRAALSGKAVAVRGKVTKFNAGILGRNWVHVQDGSGDPAQQDFDLTVTTKDNATVGQVVLIKGVLQKDKDFGAGYAYPILIEDATLH